MKILKVYISETILLYTNKKNLTLDWFCEYMVKFRTKQSDKWHFNIKNTVENQLDYLVKLTWRIIGIKFAIKLKFNLP